MYLNSGNFTLWQLERWCIYSLQIKYVNLRHVLFVSFVSVLCSSFLWPPNFIAIFVILGPILAGVFACHTFQCSIMIPIRAYIAQSLWLFVCFPNSNLQRTAFSYLISCELDFESKKLEGPIVLYPESCCSENE